MTDVPPVATVETPPSPPAAVEPIVATAGRYYRNMRYLVVAGLFIFAGFFAYDGFQRYPALNEKIAKVNSDLGSATTDDQRATLSREQNQLGAPHTDTDIALQKVLAFALPVAAVGYLVFVLRRSRGEIRLENDTLHVPGHPPVPASAITSIDDALWKKKGIAVVHYSVDGKSKSLTLDDFVYQQTPIDAIHDRLAALQTTAH